ncbi:MAG TPA: hypothetical protein VFQ30_12190 [Ktedonobacteraceae bacterium]|nr:hypothetical protein [Ktedonobacteraceae bacterium]
MLESKTFKRAYLTGTVIIWVGVWIASAVILKGTPYFGQMIPILVIPEVWFLVLIPGAFFWTRPKSKQSPPEAGT